MKYFPQLRLEGREKITKVTEHVRHLHITQALKLDLGHSWTFIITGLKSNLKTYRHCSVCPIIFGLLHPELVFPRTHAHTHTYFHCVTFSQLTITVPSLLPQSPTTRSVVESQWRREEKSCSYGKRNFHYQFYVLVIFKAYDTKVGILILATLL